MSEDRNWVTAGRPFQYSWEGSPLRSRVGRHYGVNTAPACSMDNCTRAAAPFSPHLLFLPLQMPRSPSLCHGCTFWPAPSALPTGLWPSLPFLALFLPPPLALESPLSSRQPLSCPSPLASIPGFTSHSQSQTSRLGRVSTGTKTLSCPLSSPFSINE